MELRHRQWCLALRGSPVLLLLAAGVLLPLAASGDPDPGLVALAGQYRALRGNLASNDFHAPVAVQSEEQDDSLRGDVFGVIDAEFASVKEALSSPADWCRFACLHMNVKAAVHDGAGTNSCVTLYLGGKRYQPPERSEPIVYEFKLEHLGPDYVRVAMTSEAGPHGTREHRLSCEAMPLDDGTCFVHMRYACSYGLLARSGVAVYLNTAGRKRVGFSVVSTGEDGEPVYIKGVRGIVERNAMRYYLAVKAHLSTFGMPGDIAFERSIAHWYDYTMLYPEQLDDLRKEQYLRYKRKEREQRRRLQQQVGGR